MTKNRLHAYIFLLLTTIIWGAAGPIIKFTLADFPPLIFLTYRFIISAVIGIIFLSASGGIKITKNPSLLILILFAGFLTSTVRLGSLFFGINETTSLSSSVIAASAPILMSLTGFFILKEHITKLERIGMAIALIGTLISVVEPVFAQGTSLTATLRGNGIIVFSLLTDVAAVLLMKIVVKKAITPSTFAHIAFIIGAVTVVPITLYFYPWQTIIQTIVAAPLSAHGGVWFMALISGTLAYTLLGKGLKTIEMGDASVFTYLQPLFAAPLAFFWLGETISGPFIFGSCLIALGVIIAEYKKRAK